MQNSIRKRTGNMLGGKGSLGRRAVNAGTWNLINTGSQYTIRIVSNLIMTRFLVPEAFGVLALATVLLTGLMLFTDIGINRSIIREKDGDDPAFLRVAWVMTCLRGLVIGGFLMIVALAVWLLAPNHAPEGTVYAAPELPGVIFLVALSPVLQGFVATSHQLTMRRMELKRFTLFEIAARVASLIAMVIAAQISPTAFALTLGMLTQDVLLVIFTHKFLPGPRMSFLWDNAIARRIWQFGKWLLASAVMTFVGRNADKFFLGGALGANTFGIYVIAQIWIEAGKTLIIRLAESVGFSVIAEVIRTRAEDVPKVYMRFQLVIDAFCVSAFLVVFFIGQPLIDFLYTENYSEAGHYLKLMSLSFLFLRFDPMVSLLVNHGDTRSSFIVSGTQAVAICVLIPLGFATLGVLGAILAVIMVPTVTIPYLLFTTRKYLGNAQTAFNLAFYLCGLCVTWVVYQSL